MMHPVYPSFDFETYSEAGYCWDGARWRSLPGLSDTNRGLKAVGTRNYVTHYSFAVLSLSWNLLTGAGEEWWRPENGGRPATLIDHVYHRRPLGGFNTNFEWTVWNFHCVPKFDWPYLHLETLHCSHARAKAAAYPPGLGDVADVLFTPKYGEKVGDYYFMGGDPRLPASWSTDWALRNVGVPMVPAKFEEDDDIPF